MLSLIVVRGKLASKNGKLNKNVKISHLTIFFLSRLSMHFPTIKKVVALNADKQSTGCHYVILYKPPIE